MDAPVCIRVGSGLPYRRPVVFGATETVPPFREEQHLPTLGVMFFFAILPRDPSTFSQGDWRHSNYSNVGSEGPSTF